MKFKLCVGGCSFSDYTKIEKPYGVCLSEKLNSIYIHEGAGCGSNWRIWRRVVNHITKNNITKKDILIVQYTTIERREFWSQEEGEYNIGKIKMREKYEHGGDILKFKINNPVFQLGDETKFLKLYEEKFLNTSYEHEVFITQNKMFQSFLKENEIRTIFLITPYYNGVDLNDYFLKTSLDINDFCSKTKDYSLEENMKTSFHLNQRGHFDLSLILEAHIHNLGFI